MTRPTPPAEVLLHVMGIAAALAVAGSFLYGSLDGPWGQRKLDQLLEEEIELQKQLILAKTSRDALENLTLRLSDSYLDRDLLDERARMILGLIGPDEVITR